MEVVVEKEKVVDTTENIIRSMSYANCSLPEGFAEEMSEKLHKVGRKKRSLFSEKLVFTATFVLVAFIAGFFAGKLHTPVDYLIERIFEQSVIASFDVVKGETFTVKLVYDSENDVEEVDFTISLPEGLAFHSDHPEISETRTISWAGVLKKGRNEIPFVVKSVEEGVWQIDASAQFGQKVLAHEIIVNSKNDQSLNGNGTVEEESENV
jgi:hypothetical protein